MKKNKKEIINMIPAIITYSLTVILFIFVLAGTIVSMCLYHSSNYLKDYLNIGAVFSVGLLAASIQLVVLLYNRSKNKKIAIKNTIDLYSEFNKKYDENIMFINIASEIKIGSKSLDDFTSELIAYQVCDTVDTAHILIQKKAFEFKNWKNKIDNLYLSGLYEKKIFHKFFDNNLQIINDIICLYDKIIQKEDKKDEEKRRKNKVSSKNIKHNAKKS